jgi:hypothetical protein
MAYSVFGHNLFCGKIELGQKLMAKPDLILHIGMGKTGTTALQEAFWANRDLLEQAGVTYPSLGAVTAAHHLITPFVPKAVANNGWGFLKASDWAPKLAASGAKRILMSSELIAWAAPNVVARFCADLQVHFQLKICLYLRRQDNIIMAGYNQQVKAGNQVNPIDKVLDRMMENFDFATTIALWDGAVGTQNMIVRPYERSRFPNGDLIADFLTGVLGIDVPANFKPLPKDNSNPRFSHIALEYKRLINSVSADATISGAYTAALIAYSQTHDENSSAVFFEQGLLSYAQRASILAHFAPQNKAIAQKYLGRDGLFQDELSQDAVAATAVTPQDLAGVSDWLSLHNPKLAVNLTSAARGGVEQDRPAIKRAGAALLRSLGQQTKAVTQPKRVTAPQAQQRGRRVIIHPGLPKTGTTAIQEAFFKNRDTLLRDHGILYPGLNENHTQPILGLFRDDALTNIRFAKMDAAGLVRYRDETRAQLETEIARNDWHTLVLSGEGISTMKAKGWVAMIAWLNGLGLTWIDVIFGLRNGLDLVRSAVQQNIKAGVLLESQYDKPPIMRSRARLKPILESLGKDQIMIWDFDEARTSEAGLLHHFCAGLGLAPQVCDLIAKTEVFQNESMSQTGVDALADRNRRLGKPVGVTGTEQAHFISLKGPKFSLPAEVANKVQRELAQDEAWLVRTFPKDRRKTFALGMPAMAPAADCEIIVHFGIHKTGSSSVQQTLFEAKTGMNGAAYVHGNLANSSQIIRNSFVLPERLGRRIGGSDAEGRAARARQAGRVQVTAALNRASQQACRLILSAEVIDQFNDEELAAMADFLSDFAARQTFVGYIRDPASFQRSAFQEVLKTKLTDDHLITDGDTGKLTYHRIVDRLDARFGRENVLVFPFDRMIFPQGDVVRHFLGVAGLDTAQIEVKRVNESLSMTAVKALFIYRSLLAPKVGQKPNPNAKAAFLGALGSLAGPGFQFHPELEQRIEGSNQHIFDWAEQRLNAPLPRSKGDHDEGIRGRADLMRMSAEELALFADFAASFGVTNLGSAADAPAIAAAVDQIRRACAAKIQGRIPKAKALS